MFAHVRWTAREYSGQGFAICSGEPVPLETMAARRADFSESDLPVKADGLDMANLFPDELEDSVLGEIQRRWEMRSPHNNCCYTNMGRGPKQARQ